MSVNLEEMLAEMSEDVYQRLLVASETGKWPDRSKLTPQQREYCLQLVLLWQARHNEEAQHMTVAKGGALSIKSKQALKQQFADEAVLARFKLH